MTSVSIPSLVIIGIGLSALLFAAVFGGKAERNGATLLAGNIALTWIAQASSDQAPLAAFLAIDLATAAAFGYLTFKNPEKLWPGVCGCAQLLIFVFSATRAIDFPMSEQAYLFMLSLSSLLCVGALAAGTWAARWRKPGDQDWDPTPA